MKFFKESYLFCFLLITPNLAISQVFTSDVIVQGSICVGIDCATGEAFGFDTQRFKENNLRIHFDDSSNSADFPANDWRITINDSSNGGNNYFGIDDATAGTRPLTIEAGAGNNALFIEDTGHVGLGTANPALNLHMLDGNTPTMRLEQDGSDGFTAQTWDVAGNETNFFIRDVTNGSKLPFKIKPGAPDNSIYVNSNGNVTLGAIENDEKLTVKGNISTDGAIHFRTSNNDKYRFLINSSEASFNLQDASTGNNVMVVNEDAPENTIFIHDSGNISIGSNVENRKLYINGGLTVNGDIYCLSDRRLKSNISNIKYGLSDVLQLSPKQYTFNNVNRDNLNLATGVQLGLIAQEVESIIPEVVTNDFKVEGEADQINTLKGVNYTALIPVLIHAIQEQQKEIEAKDTEIITIKAQLDQLSAKVNAFIGQSKGTNTPPKTGKIIDSDNLQISKETIAPSMNNHIEEQLDNGRSKSDILKHKETGNN